MAFPIILFFYFLFLLIPSFSSSLIPPSCDSHDSFALFQFKNSLSLDYSASEECDWSFYENKIPSYPKTASWGNNSNCCVWDGITCDSMSGHVIGVDLSCSWLQGQLHPNNSLFQLSHLQTLNLAFNDFDGSVMSPQFGDFPSLMHLNLSYSHFVGEIPLKISHLSKLVSLDLSLNDLRLESSTWKKIILNTTVLEELVLDRVNMSQVAPTSFSLLMNLSSSLVYLSLHDTLLPENSANNIFQLQNLQKLDLSWNQNLMGQLPNSIGHLKSLNVLSLWRCQFDGPIPKSFENLTQLTYLDLARNNFNGQLSFLSNIQSLTSLDLNENSFSGGLPNSIGLLKSLNFLNLGGCHLDGPIPASLENVTQLTYLDLAWNNFSGELSFLSNLQNPTLLDLSYNFFSGRLPNVFENHKKLKAFVIFQNNIEGEFPSSLCNLTQLIHLSCSSNELTLFPHECKLPNLEFLDFSYNKLQGNFPKSIFGFINLFSLSLSSNNLSGSVNLHQFSKFLNLEDLDLSNNNFLSLNSDNNISYTIPNLTHLSLLSCNITIFPKFISLPSLRGLYLYDNKLQSLPESIFGFTNLSDLSLSSNNLRGPLSLHHFSKLQNLETLDLSSNLLEGNLPIPSFDVRFFSVSNNKFSGHIPTSFCNASSLEILNLSHNNLSGHIPKCLVALPYLDVLDLQMNHFVGTIPDKFSESNSLQSLHLNNNQFEGELPLSLTNCKYLEILDVGANNMKGEFPHWLEGLSELQVLILRDNKFYGAIHSSNNTKHPFPLLRIFDVSNNHFSGSLPTAYIMEFEGMMEIDYVGVGLAYMENNYSSASTYKESVKVTLKGNEVELERILTIFTTIDLSNNMFAGEIPQVIGKLNSLKGLNLSNNKITGPIPRSIANLTNLESLDLSSNMLKGEIPLAMANLNYLEVLDLSHNQLVGEIPRAYNQDEGKLPQPTSSTDDKFGFGWKPVVLGYGCGMVFGMFMGQVVFSIGKPEWLVRIFQARPKKQAKGRRKMTRSNQRRLN